MLSACALIIRRFWKQIDQFLDDRSCIAMGLSSRNMPKISGRKASSEVI